MPKNEANNTDTRREDWSTPQWLFDTLDNLFHFELDLAASAENRKCENYIAKSDENDFFRSVKNCYLPKGWKWCNPPYGREGCGNWVNQLLKLDNVAILLPASVGAKWFKPVWDKSHCILFLDKRLTFEGAPNTAQFDSCIVFKGTDLPHKVIANKLIQYGTLVFGAGIISKGKNPVVRKPVIRKPV